MDWTRYNKLISVVVGNLIGFALVWAATKTPMAECVMIEAKQACTLLGMSQEHLTGVVMALITSLAVTVGPKNSMTPAEAIKTVEDKGVVKEVVLHDTLEGRQINNETSAKVRVALPSTRGG